MTNIAMIFLGEKQYLNVLIFNSVIISENNIFPLFCWDFH